MSETSGQHCQRGGSNPHDEREAPNDPTIQMADGRELSKPEFIEWLSKQIKWVSAKEDEHYEGMLYLKIPFEESEE